jgi:RNase H-fold protein (predicted Holliday junction resolvase)
MSTEKKYILGLDVSTKTIGIALYEDLGDKGALTVLTHVTPKIKPAPTNKNEELFKKIKDDRIRDRCNFKKVCDL